MNEFQRFCPSIRTLRFHGSKEEREEIINSRLKFAKAASDTDRDWDVVVTTYEVVNLEKSILTKIHWKVRHVEMCCDHVTYFVVCLVCASARILVKKGEKLWV